MYKNYITHHRTNTQLNVGGPIDSDALNNNEARNDTR